MPGLRMSFLRLVVNTFLVVLIGSTTSFTQPLAHANSASVVARVNKIEITEASVLDQMETLYPSVGGHGGLSAQRIKQLRATAIDELIIEELAYQKGVTEKKVVSDVVVRREYQRLRAKYGAQRFAKALSSAGITPVQYRKDLQRRMTLERILKENITDPSRMSLPAVRDYYEHNREKFKRPERVHARLFLVAVRKDASPEQEAEGKKKADRVYRSLLEGKDFGQLAEQYSDDAYRVKGGDLGWLHRGRLDPKFEEVVFNLKPGEVSKPFRTPAGYNLMKQEAREEGRQLRFEEVKDRIREERQESKQEQLRLSFIAGLKKAANIEILDASIKNSESKQGFSVAPVATH